MTQNPQDWLAGFSGGMLIGIASALLLLGNGKIAGVSGMLGRILGPGTWFKTMSPKTASVAFVFGLLVSPVIWQFHSPPPEIMVTSDALLLAVSGLMVGVGVSMANGCTSGHGVCGLSRGSVRSLVSVMLFMTTAMLVVALIRHNFVGGL